MYYNKFSEKDDLLKEKDDFLKEKDDLLKKKDSAMEVMRESISSLQKENAMLKEFYGHMVAEIELI